MFLIETNSKQQSNVIVELIKFFDKLRIVYPMIAVGGVLFLICVLIIFILKDKINRPVDIILYAITFLAVLFMLIGLYTAFSDKNNKSHIPKSKKIEKKQGSKAKTPENKVGTFIVKPEPKPKIYNEGWNEDRKCYNYKGIIIKFKRVDNESEDLDIESYYISEPLKNDLLIKFQDKNGNLSNKNIKKLMPNKIIDSLNYKDYNEIAKTLIGISIPNFDQLISADLNKAITLDEACSVFTNYMPMKGLKSGDLCFLYKSKNKTSEITKTKFVTRWRNFYDNIFKNNYYHVFLIDDKEQYIDKIKDGRDYYYGPFYFVKKIKTDNKEL